MTSNSNQRRASDWSADGPPGDPEQQWRRVFTGGPDDPWRRADAVVQREPSGAWALEAWATRADDDAVFLIDERYGMLTAAGAKQYASAAVGRVLRGETPLEPLRPRPDGPVPISDEAAAEAVLHMWRALRTYHREPDTGRAVLGWLGVDVGSVARVVAYAEHEAAEAGRVGGSAYFRDARDLRVLLRGMLHDDDREGGGGGR